MQTFRKFGILRPYIPFKDRILHTAIHRVIAPNVDKTFGTRTYACRNDMGNRNATLIVWEQVKKMGAKRYCIKLDVRKYFAHINHTILGEQINTPVSFSI